jgi:hypothetical protein
VESDIHSIGAAAMSGRHVWSTLKHIGEAGIFLHSVHLIIVCMDSKNHFVNFVYNFYSSSVSL